MFDVRTIWAVLELRWKVGRFFWGVKDLLYVSFTHFSLFLSLSLCELEKWVHTKQNWYLFSIFPSSPNENHLKKHYIKSDDMTPKCFAKKRWQWLSPLSLCFSSFSSASRWISLAPCFVLMTNVIVIITMKLQACCFDVIASSRTHSKTLFRKFPPSSSKGIIN